MFHDKTEKLIFVWGKYEESKKTLKYCFKVIRDEEVIC